jgi:predicted regulator of Ras-like GTPase activity (Roadblock/LC7/MglB family)
MIPDVLVEREWREGVSVTAFERALRDVARRVPTLRWAVIASVDGVIQAMHDPFGEERPDRILALVSSVLTLGERVFQKLQHGRLACLALTGETGVLAACPIGPAYVMAISTSLGTGTDAAVDALVEGVSLLRSVLCVGGV